MTTPKRYEEMASALRGRDGAGPLGSLDSQEVPALAEALRTAAREAQVRVLNELERLTLGGHLGYVARDAVNSIRARIDSGEDP